MITSYPFERQDTTETQYHSVMGTYRVPGVVGHPDGPELAATEAGGLTLRFAAGRVHCRGMILDNDGATDGTSDVAATTIGESDARVDRWVARFDPAQDAAYIHWLKGTPGSTTPPALTRTATGIYDVKLYRATVAAGAAGFAVDAVVDEREWVDTGIERWTTDTRPSPAGLYQVGRNLTTGRLEFWDGTQWAYHLEQRDAPTIATRYWTATRGTSPATADYGSTGAETSLVAVTIPASAPAGLYLLAPVLQIRTLSGQASNAGTLFVRTDGYVETVVADAEPITRTFTPTFPYLHPGGARSVTLAHRPTAPGVTVVNAGTAIRATYVGGL